MIKAVRTLCALAVLAGALGAAPRPGGFGPVPNDAQTALAKRYLEALRSARYDDAYALLAPAFRTYFGSAANFRSVYAADGYRLVSGTVTGARSVAQGRLFLVRERVGFTDHAADAPAEITLNVPLGTVIDHGTPRIVDRGKPYRAFGTTSSSDASGIRVSVRKVEFFSDHVGVVVRFTNTSDRFITALPYGKSVLRDAKGNVYRLIANRNWLITDKRLFQGVPLAPNAQYTGEMAFEAPGRIDGDPQFTLTVAPLLVDGGDAPFDVSVAIVPSA